jgi:leucyl-tRNA synthetase
LVDGKARDSLTVPADVTEEAARELALASARVRELLAGKESAKVVYAGAAGERGGALTGILALRRLSWS